MNLTPRWAGVLTEAGFEAAHWSSVGAITASDPEIMAWAIQHRRVVLTHDLDFGAILAASGDVTPSVVQLRGGNLSPAVLGPAVLSALRQLEDALEAGALVTIDALRTRIRWLPLV